MTQVQSPAEFAAQGTRNTWILLAAQALNGSAAVICIAVGGLAGAYLLSADKSLATLPVSMMGVGLAAGALPAALVMQWIGRRLGLMTGTGFAMAGGVVAAGALAVDSFWLFVLGLVLVGFSTAFVQQYRFAAAESVSAEMRGIAISRVMIGGVITALIAPQILLYTRDVFGSIQYAGAFLALSAVALVGLGVLTMLRFPPRLSARVSTASVETPRPLLEIARQPRFLVTLLCAASSFALMAFVMTAAPLAMVDPVAGHSEAEAVLGIQWHVIAMFAPSLVTGRLIKRLGKEAIVGTGLVLLMVSAAVGTAGIELLHFWGMLILLGVGWNFSFVGATAMLTDAYRPSERGRVEGFNDLIVFGMVALASFFSGQILATSGWYTINVIVMPVVVIVLLSLLVLVLRQRSASA